PRPTIWTNRRAIGVDGGGIGIVCWQFVGAGKLACSDLGHNDAVGTIRASIMHKDVTQPNDAPIGIQRNADIMHLPSFLVGADHMLHTVLNPLDRSTQPY